jgi:hypothetical protein
VVTIKLTGPGRILGKQLLALPPPSGSKPLGRNLPAKITANNSAFVAQLAAPAKKSAGSLVNRDSMLVGEKYGVQQ